MNNEQHVNHGTHVGNTLCVVLMGAGCSSVIHDNLAVIGKGPVINI